MSVAAIFEYHNIVNYGTFVASSLQMLSLLVMFIFSWGPQIALAGTLNPLWIQQWGRPQNNRKLHSLKLWCRGLAALFFHGLEVCSFSFVIVLLREQRKLEGLSPGSPWITVCCWSWLVAVGIYFFHFWWTACAILPIMNMGARQYYRLHLDFDHTIPEGRVNFDDLFHDICCLNERMPCFNENLRCSAERADLLMRQVALGPLGIAEYTDEEYRRAQKLCEVSLEQQELETCATTEIV
ncbi:hypothetical protein MMC24_003719 [Lignoscripta atroalba]|nr:hypothetical protein [Lignoscripta atroalba]